MILILIGTFKTRNMMSVCTKYRSFFYVSQLDNLTKPIMPYKLYLKLNYTWEGNYMPRCILSLGAI